LVLPVALEVRPRRATRDGRTSLWYSCHTAFDSFVRNALAAALAIVLAYLAWIPAAADSAHPTLELVTSIVFYGAVLASVVIFVRGGLGVGAENKRRVRPKPRAANPAKTATGRRAR